MIYYDLTQNEKMCPQHLSTLFLRANISPNILLVCFSLASDMSVLVLHQGQRKKVQINPSAPVQSLIDEAAKLFDVNPSDCNLLHNKKPIERSQPFRFTGIAYNSTLELVVSKSNSSQQDTSIRIAFTADGIGSKTSTFR